ncbi:unnamed protein product [Owenia fusiformis]|uniref:Vacuolar protein-sorting-associated protein 36 n=1 Tax=Owenia fusiformis TaxID=6347 RepID=A0A8J1XMQ5_OWEFU|nr:unnamed protein product [Owenia fusiformis]
MDRFSWSDGHLATHEVFVTQQSGVKLYDGEDKTNFNNGTIVLSSHNLMWRDHVDQKCVISLSLAQVVFLEESSSGLGRSAKIIVHLSAPPSTKVPGPVSSSQNNYIRLSFTDGGQVEFFRCFTEELARRRWEHTPTLQPLTAGRAQSGTQPRRAGIVGIERKIQQKHETTDKNISVAFEDLSKLMVKAKEMVSLSKTIANKITDKQGAISEDETVKFKSYLLSMGIPDPVTRETHGTGDGYYRELAKQLSHNLEQQLKDCGGMMTLSDVYCRTNRARGMELLSPEDLINACNLLEELKLPIRFRVFDSGVMVLHLLSHSEAEVINQTTQFVEENTKLTAEELAQLVGVSVVLAKERLLSSEKAGKLCRDETVEALRFYPNLFLTKT